MIRIAAVVFFKGWSAPTRTYRGRAPHVTRSPRRGIGSRAARGDERSVRAITREFRRCPAQPSFSPSSPPLPSRSRSCLGRAPDRWRHAAGWPPTRTPAWPAAIRYEASRRPSNSGPNRRSSTATSRHGSASEVLGWDRPAPTSGSRSDSPLCRGATTFCTTRSRDPTLPLAMWRFGSA
jgi:hypothetical protein